MTKLLTALLIAGLSVTAKAEPAVYYCDMKAFVELTADGSVSEYRLERFPMKVEESQVSFGGDGYMSGSKWSLKYSFLPEFGNFTYIGVYGVTGIFVDNILTMTKHGFGEQITSFVARCDIF